jgi:flagellar M-ring protein FliF
MDISDEYQRSSMPDNVKNIVEMFKTIPLGKKISFAITFLVLMAGFAGIYFYTNKTDYQVLFSNLETTDAASISEKLAEDKTPYQLKDGGRTILVPSDQVYQLRLNFASSGLPKGDNVGFEVLDNMSFGTTEFVQKLKYQQALQGELAKTITQFDSIAQARVHIVQAGDSLFAEQEKQATASVVVRLKQGKTLDQKQLQGIINLVSCSVQGLKPSNVSVVDMAGGILTKSGEEDSVSATTENQLDFQKKVEKGIEKQIQTMLEQVVGVGKVVARVSADINLTQVNTSEETYDPDSAVIRSEQHQTESSSGGSGSKASAGSPDLQYQVYQTESGEEGSGDKYSKDNSVINYEISKVNKQTIDTSGDIKRLSAAVIIDGTYVEQAGEGGKSVQKYVARESKEMKTFEDIVKKAMGFSESRGDQVTVSNVSFNLQKDNTDALAEEKTGFMDYAKKGYKPLINIALVVLFLLFAIRPLKKFLENSSGYTPPKALPQGEFESPEHRNSELQLRQSNKQHLLEATRKNPDVAADIIKTWINEVS